MASVRLRMRQDFSYRCPACQLPLQLSLSGQSRSIAFLLGIQPADCVKCGLQTVMPGTWLKLLLVPWRLAYFSIFSTVEILERNDRQVVESATQEDTVPAREIGRADVDSPLL